MDKRIAVLVGATALALTASSMHAVAKGSKVSIKDPLGDANFVNDQGTGDGSAGDVNAADAGTVSDLLVVGFRNDAKNLYVEIQPEAAPPALTGIGYRVRVNPDGAAGTHCLLFEAFFPGANNALTAGEAVVRDTCAGGDATPVEVLGTTIVVPRKGIDALGKGKKLVDPQAQSFLWSGSSYPAGFAGPYADTTRIGKDYKLVDKKKK